MENFGIGEDRDENFWSSIFRHAMINNLIYKEIEQFGILKVSEAGREYAKEPLPHPNHHQPRLRDGEYDLDDEKGGTAVLDEPLMNMLKDLRKSASPKSTTCRPTSFSRTRRWKKWPQLPEFRWRIWRKCRACRRAKRRNTASRSSTIKKYCEENEIERPMDITIKTVANKSKTKVNIITAIDRKIPLEDIAKSNDMSWAN
jgi:ATP-dependent DNA helicase RecQ